MSVTYLTTPIVEVRNDPPPHGSGLTRDGYTKRSGAPTARMIRLQGEKRWRRLMVWHFSNLGTMFVNINGKPHVVREEMLPREGAVSSHATKSRHPAMKRSPTQLTREINAALKQRVASGALPPYEGMRVTVTKYGSFHHHLRSGASGTITRVASADVRHGKPPRSRARVLVSVDGSEVSTDWPSMSFEPR